MSKATIKAEIDANIRQNGQQLITGNVLNGVLNDIVDDYGEQEKLSELEEEVNNIDYNLFGNSSITRFYQGGYTNSSLPNPPTFLEQSNRVRTNLLVMSKPTNLHFSINEGFQYYYDIYKIVDGSYTRTDSSNDWKIEEGSKSLKSNEAIIFSVRKIDNSTIVPRECDLNITLDTNSNIVQDILAIKEVNIEQDKATAFLVESYKMLSLTNNIIDIDPTILYPISIRRGSITISREDGGNLNVHSGLQIELYDINKTKIHYWGVNVNDTKRTMAWTDKDAYYCKFNVKPSVNFMVEVGDAVTKYEPYENIVMLKNKNGFVSDSYNLLKNGHLQEITSNGITFTPVYDGNSLLYIVANGTATADAYYRVCESNLAFNIKAGERIILSGCPANGSTHSYAMYAVPHNGSKDIATLYNLGGDYVWTATEDVTNFRQINIRIYPNTTVRNLMFRPMITKGVSKPYIPSFINHAKNELGNINTYSGDFAELTFMNRGLGDIGLVRFRDKVVMVDVGNNYHDDPSSPKWTSARLRERGVNHVDYVIISHYHGDHVMGLSDLIEDGFIDSSTSFYLPEDLRPNASDIFVGERTDTFSLYDDRFVVIMNLINGLGSEKYYPIDGDRLYFGNCYFEFWNCDHSPYYERNSQGTTEGTTGSTNYNDLSLCCHLFVGNNVIAYTGDIGQVAQERVGGTLYPCNILKAQHHGWDGSANGLIPSYINNLSPKMVVSMDYVVHEDYIVTERCPMQTWCERNSVPNYRTYKNNNAIDIHIDMYGIRLLGKYSQYIRNNKNWKFTDNSEYIE